MRILRGDILGKRSRRTDILGRKLKDIFFHVNYEEYQEGEKILGEYP